jgi:antitoxin (DNA-binding transcriptional repressor) of toxin-antitoxin stability system
MHVSYHLITAPGSAEPKAVLCSLRITSGGSYEVIMLKDMAVIHMSEAEAARDFYAVLSKVRQGLEVIIEQDHLPVAVIKTPFSQTGPGRKLSECIALAKAYEEKLGYAPVPDADFAQDVQAGIG